MATPKGSMAPASFAEGANAIVAAISATMTAPDSGPHLPFLQQLLQATVGQLQSKGQAPQAPKPAGGPPGGGTNISQLMGQPASPPSAGPGGPPASGSSTGISQDDMRRVMAAQQGA